LLIATFFHSLGTTSSHANKLSVLMYLTLYHNSFTFFLALIHASRVAPFSVCCRESAPTLSRSFLVVCDSNPFLFRVLTPFAASFAANRLFCRRLFFFFWLLFPVPTFFFFLFLGSMYLSPYYPFSWLRSGGFLLVLFFHCFFFIFSSSFPRSGLSFCLLLRRPFSHPATGLVPLFPLSSNVVVVECPARPLVSSGVRFVWSSFFRSLC